MVAIIILHTSQQDGTIVRPGRTGGQSEALQMAAIAEEEEEEEEERGGNSTGAGTGLAHMDKLWFRRSHG